MLGFNLRAGDFPGKEVVEQAQYLENEHQSETKLESRSGEGCRGFRGEKIDTDTNRPLSEKCRKKGQHIN